MFGGHGAPLPADVAMRMAKGEIYPEDASALRASNYDDWAAVADQHRESILERTRQATREREKANPPERATVRNNANGLRCRWAAHGSQSTIRGLQQLKHVSSGESLVADDSSLRTDARRTQRQTIP